MDQDVLSAFTALISRHSTTIKNAEFVMRMEWNDIATALNAKQKKHRPESPWGVIPSLSIPSNPAPFIEYIWPNIPFQLRVPETVKAYLGNNTDKVIVVHLRALDLAAIALYGLV